MSSVCKQVNRKTDMNWSKVDGARQQKRTLILRESQDKTYICPVKCCENRAFFSKRGCRKHVDTKHRWYSYFDEKPSEKLIEKGIKEQQSSSGASKCGDGLKKRADTTKRPYYPISSGIGKKYIEWLCAVCGGGKLESQATQNGIRVMKFLKHCSEDGEEELTEEHIDYCIGSAQDICKFIEHIGKEWVLGSSVQFGYLQAITDLIDFRKSNGLSATVLGNLAVSEVYINRGKRALARRKLTEWSKNLSVEIVFAAIGKYVHPTRYRQILETESSRKLSAEEQDMVSRDQKHSSQVARTYYQKRISREIATSAKRAMKKLQNGEVDKELKKLAFASDSSSDCEDATRCGEDSYEVVDCPTQGDPCSTKQMDLGKDTLDSDTIDTH
eukprot:Seg5583.2 transcript_id=Seg5583.2/GoldUCD/mRNA.D3Y31 product="hypothetical protein" protein_id=Seg5583.2/GoldUCD/D3Y31